MLIRRSLPSSIDAETWPNCLNFLRDWMPGTEIWPNHPECDIHSKVSHWKAATITGEGVLNGSSSSNTHCSCSVSPAIEAIIHRVSSPLVYRRRLRKNSATDTSAKASTNKNSEHCLSAVTSALSPTAAVNGQGGSQAGPEIETGVSPLRPTRDLHPIIPKLKFIVRCSDSELDEDDQAPESYATKNTEFQCANDSFSSSKLNAKHGSVSSKVEVDESCESSSSGMPAVEAQKDLSEKDFCISILTQEGLLGKSWPVTFGEPPEDVDISSYGNCSQPCKVCGHSDLSYSMIICDDCEEAYHVSCCTLRMKKIPVNEWSCPSCLKKKHKLLSEDSRGKSVDAPISLMLKDKRPYITSVRIGKDFQADVPQWDGCMENEDADCFIGSLEMGPSVCNLNTSRKHSSIGNWLQCREVIEGMGDGFDGTVCGKWRRAPLFEVQTDDWDCFCSIHWDPTHADCAVPQELDTEEVLKQLKYIEMLRPRLASKRQKLSRAEANRLRGPIENHRFS